jgi:hypothetical protein
MMLAGLSTWHATASQIVVLGSAEETLPLRREIARQYLPFALLVPVTPGEPQRAIAASLPFVGAMQQVGGRATAFVCRSFTCGEPVNTPEALAAQLLPA